MGNHQSNSKTCVLDREETSTTFSPICQEISLTQSQTVGLAPHLKQRMRIAVTLDGIYYVHEKKTVTFEDSDVALKQDQTNVASMQDTSECEISKGKSTSRNNDLHYQDERFERDMTLSGLGSRIPEPISTRNSAGKLQENDQNLKNQSESSYQVSISDQLSKYKKDRSGISIEFDQIQIALDSRDANYTIISDIKQKGVVMHSVLCESRFVKKIKWVKFLSQFDQQFTGKVNLLFETFVLVSNGKTSILEMNYYDKSTKVDSRYGDQDQEEEKSCQISSSLGSTSSKSGKLYSDQVSEQKDLATTNTLIFQEITSSSPIFNKQSQDQRKQPQKFLIEDEKMDKENHSSERSYQNSEAKNDLNKSIAISSLIHTQDLKIRERENKLRQVKYEARLLDPDYNESNANNESRVIKPKKHQQNCDKTLKEKADKSLSQAGPKALNPKALNPKARPYEEITKLVEPKKTPTNQDQQQQNPSQMQEQQTNKQSIASKRVPSKTTKVQKAHQNSKFIKDFFKHGNQKK
eukprot:403376824